jgi:hypothetical protein
MTDQHGVSVSSTDPAALAHYDAAVDAILHFRPAVIEELGAAIAVDPTMPMAQVLSAYLGLMGTEANDSLAAGSAFRTWWSDVDVSRLTPTEAAHADAVQAWLAGDLRGCAQRLRVLTTVEPREAVALAMGHQLDFFTGDATSLRDRVGGALTAWTADDPHRAQVLGMYAFGLEEAGHYDRSEDVGRECVELDQRDVWGIHAVVHTYEMQGRFGAGAGYLDERTPDWSSSNFLSIHNWWHRCLYALEGGDTELVLAIYDATIHNDQSARVAMEMLDAAALLWRLTLEGDHQATRWRALADAWDGTVDEPFYAFNDMHAVMSFVGAGRINDARRLIDSRESWLATGPPARQTNAAMTREIGLPVCESIVAFGQERYSAVVDLLAPIRYCINEFGGSHAQRDAVQRTLLEAALRANQLDLARTLVSERINLRPCSPYNWLKQAALADRLGRAAAAAAARDEAQRYAASGGRLPRDDS